MQSFEKAIISTLAYFDIFDYPLTATEIWKWLFLEEGGKHKGTESIESVMQALNDNEYLRSRVDSKFGFYFLKGREEIVTTRMDRYRLAERKWHKAKKIVRFLRHVPFVKMIGICNTLAYNNSRPQADIDLFIISKRNRVWQTRFWVTGFLKFFHLRPQPEKTQDTLCASFFVDEDHLNIKSLGIENDIYLPYWIAQVFPLYDEGYYQKFLLDNNWILETLPNVFLINPASRRKIERARVVKALLTAITFFIPEKMFRRYQKRIMPERLNELANKDSRVVVKDYMLKFHDTDRRGIFLNKWQQRRAEIL